MRRWRLHPGELQSLNRAGGGTTIRMRLPLNTDVEG